MSKIWSEHKTTSTVFKSRFDGVEGQIKTTESDNIEGIQNFKIVNM